MFNFSRFAHNNNRIEGIKVLLSSELITSNSPRQRFKPSIHQYLISIIVRLDIVYCGALVMGNNL